MSAYTSAVYVTAVKEIGVGNGRNYLPVDVQNEKGGEKVAAPMSKKIMAADVKMTKELAKIGLSATEIQKIKDQRQEDMKEKEAQKEKKEMEKKERALKKELRQQEKVAKEKKLEEDRRITQELRKKLMEEHPQSYAPHPAQVAMDAEQMGEEPAQAADKDPGAAKKAKRKPPQGPMTEALKKFIDGKRVEGMTYWQAMSAWSTSSEREAIVSKMATPERKRRKYDNKVNVPNP